MIKIKDDVDLRTLKKYFYNTNLYLTRGREIAFKNLITYRDDEEVMELLFDLIKADLVEKVVEK